MQDRHLCWPPPFPWTRSAPPHLFHSRIATVNVKSEPLLAGILIVSSCGGMEMAPHLNNGHW